jgi:hypothetical protein
MQIAADQARTPCIDILAVTASSLAVQRGVANAGVQPSSVTEGRGPLASCLPHRVGPPDCARRLFEGPAVMLGFQVGLPLAMSGA